MVIIHDATRPSFFPGQTWVKRHKLPCPGIGVKMRTHLRLLHTSDWHLGHALFGHPRRIEHEAFLRWLLDLLKTREIDLLIIAGDIFDKAQPPAGAFKLYYDFLGEATRRCPRLEIVIIGGNHDSPAWLGAHASLAQNCAIQVVSALGNRVPESLVLPIQGGRGHVLALPYLAPGDITRYSDESEADPEAPRGQRPEAITEAHRRLYHRLCAHAQSLGGAPIIAVGHLYMVGSLRSEDSELAIQRPSLLHRPSHEVGTQIALPSSIFPDAVDYAALGHLHRPQQVGAHAKLRYAGSPIPLSFPERRHVQQVLEVNFEDGQLSSITPHPVPRRIPLWVWPEKDEEQTHLPLQLALKRMQKLQVADKDADHSLDPLLFVRLLLEPGESLASAKLATAAEARHVRLLKTEFPRLKDSPDRASDRRPLEEQSPEAVFLQCYQATHQQAPEPEVLRAFRELLESVKRGESA